MLLQCGWSIFPIRKHKAIFEIVDVPAACTMRMVRELKSNICILECVKINNYEIPGCKDIGQILKLD